MCTGRKATGTDGNVSLSHLVVLVLRPCITYRTWTTEINRIPLNIPVCRGLWSADRKLQRFRTIRLGYFLCNILTESLAFPLHSPSTECVPADSVSTEPRSMVNRHVTLFSQLTLLQIDWNVTDITVYLFTLR
jgi:hypothetical protein